MNKQTGLLRYKHKWSSVYRKTVLYTSLLAILILGVLLCLKFVIWPWLFYSAVKDGDVKRVRYYIDRGVYVNTSDTGHTTALMAASNSGYADIVTILIERGANVHARDGWHGTAMMYAAVNGHLKVVKRLLEHGVPVNERSRMDRTPLMWASLNGHDLIIGYLLENGADRNLVDEEGKTAEDLSKGE